MNTLRVGADFDGHTYQPELDFGRLTSQLIRVYVAMRDGRWRTLDEIQVLAGGQQAAVSARLRDLRKSKFGAHTVERRRRGNGERGLFEYRLCK
jgi:hypothetical protein